MKTTIFVVGLAAVLAELALAQTNPPAVPSGVTNSPPPDELVTKLGAVYKNFRVERADPGGLVISYTLDGGGIGMEKVPFSFLPDDWQKRYKYDPKKAAQFDLEQKQAMAEWREKMIADEQAYRDKRAQQQAAEAAAEQAKRDAEAAAALGTNAPAISTNVITTIQATNAPPMTETNLAPAPPQ